jgi:hypothetical protein
VARRKRRRRRRPREWDRQMMMEMMMEMMITKRTAREREDGLRGWRVTISERTARRIGARTRFVTLDLYGS